MSTTQAPEPGEPQNLAEFYDRLFVPPVMAPWAVRLADAVGIAPGERVLDVACGTGAATLEAARRTAPGGRVTGVDLTPEMLEVARRRLPDVELVEAGAESLPLPDSSFDVVLCQFGLMFFEDRARALREMLRVLRPGGRIGVSVWDRLESSPGYAVLTALVDRHLGEEAGGPIRAAFALGHVEDRRRELQTAGARDVDARSVPASVRFPSLARWLEAETRGWIGGEFDEARRTALLRDAEEEMAGCLDPDGSLEFLMPAILVTGRRHDDAEP